PGGTVSTTGVYLRLYTYQLHAAVLSRCPGGTPSPAELAALHRPRQKWTPPRFLADRQGAVWGGRSRSGVSWRAAAVVKTEAHRRRLIPPSLLARADQVIE